jgi:signal transduction histidine kinase
VISQPIRWLIAGLVVVGLIGVVDLITGPDYGFAFFYFIPIVPVAWRGGRVAGLITATAAAAMWFWADASLKPAQEWGAVAWNAASRLAIFLAGAYLIDVVRKDRSRSQLIDEQRDEFLRVLEHELPVPAQDMIASLNAAQARGTLAAEDIEALRQKAESLLFLTRDFVALGQAQASRLQLRAVPVDLAQLVTEISRQGPGGDAVPLSVPGDGLIVYCDPDRLRQALSNAVAELVIKAGELEYVSITVRARGSDALVVVSAAMPATATKVVDPETVGVSLQLTRMLMEAMGGSMLVERAALGKGSRVTMSIPVRDPGAAAPSATEPRPVR